MLAIASLSVAATCAVAIALDQFRRPPRMRVMAPVWPLAALFGSLIWLGIYYKWGQRTGGPGCQGARLAIPISVLTGARHCGAGCTLGDICAERLAVALPAVALWFGYGTVFDERMFAIWIPDFLLAFLFGIDFQYFAIRPMRDLSSGQGLAQALKAAIASITAWQVGMYGGMALIQFALFRRAFGGIAPVASPEFWLRCRSPCSRASVPRCESGGSASRYVSLNPSPSQSALPST